LFTDPSPRPSQTRPRRLAGVPSRLPVPYSLPERLQDESGVGLVEILIVILIIGVLAAIALPSFLNQKTKAYDAAAKELVHSAATAAETYSTDHGGEYTGVSATELQKYEPTLQVCEGAPANACLKEGKPIENGKGYEVIAKAANTGDEFTIAMSSTGAITRTCTSPTGRSDCSGSPTSSW